MMHLVDLIHMSRQLDTPWYRYMYNIGGHYRNTVPGVQHFSCAMSISFRSLFSKE